jgi:hypothetical protein
LDDNTDQRAIVTVVRAATLSARDSETDLFGTSALLSGAGGCGTSATYKLVGEKLVMQKFVADWNCGDQYSGQVIYDINKSN